MKKIISILLTAVIILALSASMVIGSSAVDSSYIWQINDALDNEHLVINVGDPYQFNPSDATSQGFYSGLFQWGLQSGCTVSDGALHVPAVEGGRTFVSIYADQSAGGWPHSLSIDTAVFKYIAFTYKTAADASVHFMFTYNKDKLDGSDFDVNGCNPDFSLPASNEWTTVVCEIPQSKVQQTVSLMTRFDVFCTSQVDMKNIGFFNTEAAAKTYYNIGQDNPGTDEPAVQTADYIGVAVIVLAACAAAVVLSKKK